MYKGDALESIFSPAIIARSKLIFQTLLFKREYHNDESVVASASRHVKNSFVASVPVAKNLALERFKRMPK